MYKTLTVLLLIGCVAFATERKGMSVLDTKLSLAELDKDHFGATMLSAI
jgi:hypothetical protein